MERGKTAQGKKILTERNRIYLQLGVTPRNKRKKGGRLALGPRKGTERKKKKKKKDVRKCICLQK